jgi:hypothetical protein
MLPTMVTYEMVKMKIEEDLQQAARERRAREAVGTRPHAIDFTSVKDRIRVRFLGGHRGDRPATAGA